MSEDIINTLKTFKKLCEENKDHNELLKDRTLLLYTATMLESPEENIVHLCLDILKLLSLNEDNHKALLNTFGIFEALESLSIKSREKRPIISKKSAEIVETLRLNAPPAYRTRLRVASTSSTTSNKRIKKTSFMYSLFIEELCENNKNNFEQALLKIRGIVSFVLDVNQRRCTVRISPRSSIKTVVAKIQAETGLSVLAIAKNLNDGTEDFYDVLQDAVDEKNLDYFPEEDDTPDKAKSLRNFEKLTSNAGGLFKSVLNVWNKSFYW